MFSIGMTAVAETLTSQLTMEDSIIAKSTWNIEKHSREVSEITIDQFQVRGLHHI